MLTLSFCDVFTELIFFNLALSVVSNGDLVQRAKFAILLKKG